MNKFTIHAFLLVILFQSAVFNCKDDKRTADIAPKLDELPSFAGQWNLEATGAGKGESERNRINILFLDPEKKSAMLGDKEFILEMDALGLRIRPTDHQYAIGYFLYSEIKDRTWVGTWEDRVARLQR